MFAQSKTGLAADRVYFDDNHDFVTKTVGTEYRLRSEFVESLFILSQITQDPIYTEWGWEVFENINRHCKTQGGFTTVGNVNSVEGDLVDEAPSYFTAKTIKYLFLLFHPDSTVDLQKTILTSGGHLLPIFIE